MTASTQRRPRPGDLGRRRGAQVIGTQLAPMISNEPAPPLAIADGTRYTLAEAWRTAWTYADAAVAVAGPRAALPAAYARAGFDALADHVDALPEARLDEHAPIAGGRASLAELDLVGLLRHGPDHARRLLDAATPPAGGRFTLADFDSATPSLGWAVAGWMHENLTQPDGPRAGEPFRLTAEQLTFVLYWYALDERGAFAFRRGVFRRSKGAGKSPFVAALCLAELCGPVRLAGWDEHGKPVGKPHPAPWVIVAGVSEVQTENTLRTARGMAQNSPLAVEQGGPLDIGKSRILHTGNDGTLTSITANSATQEGARPTFAVADEPHHWMKSNGGHALMRVIRRNLAKVQGRLIETTNAHEPGQDSVAEASYLAYLKQAEGQTPKRDILYDCREAPPISTEDLADEEKLRAALQLAYGDSTWVDLDPLVAEIYDPSTPVEEGRRFYLNQIVAAADSWLRPDVYGLCESDTVPALAPGETVTLGFDGSLTDDSTALVACRVSDGAPFLLALWEKPDGPAGDDWAVEKPVVRDTVDNVFTTYDVVAFFADVAYWETDTDAWRDTYAEKLLVKATTRHAVQWDMRSHQAETVYGVEALHRAFTDGEMPMSTTHENAPRLKRHLLNARRRPGRYGVGFGKETRESPKKVDALAALVLARMARSRILADDAMSKRKTAKTPGRYFGFGRGMVPLDDRAAGLVYF